MDKRSILALIAPLALAATARAETAKPSLEGTYTYSTTFTIKLTAPVEQTIHDTTTGELTIGKSSKADLLFSWSAKGYTCHLKASRTSNGVKFVKGQTCTQTQEGVGDLVLTVESGGGTVNDEDLDLKMTWRISGTMGGHAVSGSATESTTCDRQ